MKLDAQAQGVIVTSLGDEAILHILNYETPGVMWLKLESIYE
uniref:Uncharacterized protein n=1 Tax=Megaselia scalaris TaxID=36166 RepID=T1H374_MEGSC